MKLNELIEQYKDNQKELEKMVILSCVRCGEVFNVIPEHCPGCGYPEKKG